mmetsp:Transcript_36792/g.95331  ORF Transcript_36792/g.95331 Transcript_36792/m.95331 type:complete len:481 (-) Transcript_36792:62-1504(-)
MTAKGPRADSSSGGCTSTALPAGKVPDEVLVALASAQTKGNALFQEGQLTEAVEVYEQSLEAIEAFPPESWSDDVKRVAVALYCNVSHILLKSADRESACLEQACAAAGKALAIDPSNVKALFRRGCAHGLAKRWQLAADDLNEVLLLEPGNDAARRELQRVQGTAEWPQPFATEVASADADKVEGTRLFQAGLYFDAYAAWKQGLDTLDGIPAEMLGDRARKLAIALCNNAAQALLRCTDVEGASTERARVMAQKALALDPHNVKALFRRGCAYFNAEKWELARADFEQVLQLEPGNEAAARELARLEEAAAVAPAGDAAGASDAPGDVTRRALREGERFRREVLALADRHGCGEKWCQRFSKLQVQACHWAQHQLSDPEMRADLIEVWGPMFSSLDEQQREDFLSSYEFVADVKAQFADELRLLRRTGPEEAAAADEVEVEAVAKEVSGGGGAAGEGATAAAAVAAEVEEMLDGQRAV